MPIDPLVLPGLAAWRRSDYHAARTAWEDPAAGTSGDHHALLSALADLAGSLERQEVGHREAAAHLLGATRARLGELPAQVLGLDVDRLRAELPADPAAALTAPPGLHPAQAIPRWAVGRFALLLLILAAGFLILRYTPLGARLNAFLDRDRLEAVRSSLRARWWTAPALLGLYAVLAPLGAPVSPLMLAGGAIFGVVWGSAVNFLGTFIGGALSFYLARWLGRDFVAHLVGERLRRVERLVARRGFWPLVRTRFLPIPFPVVNYGAALAGVPASLFLLTTGLGLVPANIVFAYLSASLVDAVEGDRAGIVLRVVLATAGLLALSFLPNVLVGRQRRRRYREIVARRRSRAG